VSKKSKKIKKVLPKKKTAVTIVVGERQSATNTLSLNNLQAQTKEIIYMDNIKHLFARQSAPKLYAIPNTTKNFYAVFETQ
jgi:histidyl-tRNA synthetase